MLNNPVREYQQIDEFKLNWPLDVSLQNGNFQFFEDLRL